MKDPYTLVAAIRTPWGTPLIDVWHKDPGGFSNDDSCGWSWPRLTEQQWSRMRDLGFWEGRERHYLRYPGKAHLTDLGERQGLYLALVLTVARMLGINMRYDDAAKIAAEKAGRGGFDGLDTVFCWLPGYHTNRTEDLAEERADHFARICSGVAREILRRRRHWYRHPRWHMHHWRLTFHPWRRLAAAVRKSP